GIAMSMELAHYRQGRPQPAGQACQATAERYVFLMNWDEPISFVGRYFCPIPLRAIIGRANPLWTLGKLKSCASHVHCTPSACLTPVDTLPLPRATSRHTLGTVAGLGVPLGARGSAHWLHTLYSMAARNSPFPLLDPGSTLMGVNVHGPRDVDNRMRTQRR